MVMKFGQSIKLGDLMVDIRAYLLLHNIGWCYSDMLFNKKQVGSLQRQVAFF